MPNTPTQFPNFDLPGAEWFGLAPNANIAIQGRRRAYSTIPLVSIKTYPGFLWPPMTDLGIMGSFTQIESGFLPTSGIYIHHAWLYVGDESPGNVQIVCSLLSLNLTGNEDLQSGYPIGLTNGIQTTPLGPLLLIDNRDFLVTAKDLAGAVYDPQTDSPVPPTTNLSMQIYIAITSTGTTGRYWARAGIVYTRLDGLTE